VLSAVSVSALQLVLGAWRRPVDFQVGLHNAVTEEGRSRSGRSWFLPADFESVRHLQAAQTHGGKAVGKIPYGQQSVS